MRDLSVRGVYRRHVVEPAIDFFGTTDPTIVGDPSDFFVRTALLASGSGWVRPVLDQLARSQHGPASWWQNVCEDVVGTVSFTRTWTHVDVRIGLDPQAGVSATTVASLQTSWRAAIEGTWNNPRRTVGAATAQQWCCARAGEVSCRVSFRVHWVTSAPHHVVKVHSGSGRANEYNWYVMDPPQVAAHEFGHMLGLPDEYVDDELCEGRAPVSTGTVMDNNSTVVTSPLVQWVPDAIGSTLS